MPEVKDREHEISLKSKANTVFIRKSLLTLNWAVYDTYLSLSGIFLQELNDHETIKTLFSLRYKPFFFFFFGLLSILHSSKFTAFNLI